MHLKIPVPENSGIGFILTKSGKIVVSAFLLLIYVTGRLFAVTRYPGIVELTWISILFSGTVAVFFPILWNRNLWLKSLIIISAGFFIEWAGIKSGLIFGHYYYGNILGANVSGVPVIIGFCWLLITYLASCLLYIPGLKLWLNAVVIAASITIFDFLLEPVALQFKWWIWQDHSIPVLNYFSWFLIAFVFSLMLLPEVKKTHPNQVGGIAFILVLVVLLSFIPFV